MNSPTMNTGKKPMQTLGSKLRRNVVVAVICLSTMTNSGCLLTGGFIDVVWRGMTFWKTLACHSNFGLSEPADRRQTVDSGTLRPHAGA